MTLNPGFFFEADMSAAIAHLSSKGLTLMKT